MDKNIGKRKSDKRELIFEIIKSAPGPLSVNAILKTSNKRNLSIGIATIYRTIKILLAKGDVKTVNLPDGQTRYAIPSKECLHHFLCKSCDIVLVIDHCCLHLHRDEVGGHHVDNHDITLTGICKDCN